MEILYGTITALVSVVIALVGLLKFYVPKKTNANSNPGTHVELNNLTSEIGRYTTDLHTHNKMAQEHHREVLMALSRIETKLG